MPEGNARNRTQSLFTAGILAHVPMIAPAPIDMGSGDIFALISDGVFEYSNPAGEQFGWQRIEGIIRSSRLQPLEEIRRNLCGSVRVFSGDGHQEDDTTIVLARP